MPRVFNELLGKEVLVPEPLTRIVSLSPAATETLFMLGLGDNVVGVSKFCLRPQEARNRKILGTYNTVDFELPSGLDPEIIFTTTGFQRALASDLSGRFNVYPILLPTSVAEVIGSVVEIGLATGRYDEARHLASKLTRVVGAYEPSRSEDQNTEVLAGTVLLRLGELSLGSSQEVWVCGIVFVGIFGVPSDLGQPSVGMISFPVANTTMGVQVVARHRMSADRDRKPDHFLYVILVILDDSPYHIVVKTLVKWLS